MSRGPQILQTLSSRTVLLTVGVAVMAAMVTIGVSVPLINNAAKAQATASLARLADVTAEAVNSTERRPGARSEQIQLLLRSQPNVQGHLISEQQGLPFLDPALQAEIMAGRPVETEAVRDGIPNLVVGRRMLPGIGLVLTAPASVARRPAEESIRQLSVALLVGVLVAIGIGYLASKTLTRPLRKVAEAAERLTTGERGLRVEPQGPAEVVDIADSLNDLSAALATSEGRQRDFLLSISHELRTPLTAVRGYAEALADGVVSDPEDVSHTASIVRSEAERLDRLVADLLVLARLEAVDFPINSVDFDIAELGHEAAEVWASRCRAEGVTFMQRIPEHPVSICSDPVRVRQIIDNLAENALRMTPVGAPVVLEIVPEETTVTLWVRDGGPGLTQDDMGVAFQPAVLYSRYSGQRKVGSGVGLALVGKLARRLGGSAGVMTAPEGGAAFSVTLPYLNPLERSPQENGVAAHA